MTSITIALADDHDYFRKGLIEILSSVGNVRVLIEAANGQDLINKISSAERLPDICLLDVWMPVLNGFDTLSYMTKEWPSIKVLVLSMFDHVYTVVNMIKNGACGFLTKSGDPSELKIALKSVYETGYYHSTLLSAYTKQIFSSAAHHNESLTPREKEFLIHCCSNLHYKQIAELMCVSVHTVDSYRASTFKKIGVNSRAALVLFALQTGMA